LAETHGNPSVLSLVKRNDEDMNYNLGKETCFSKLIVASDAPVGCSKPMMERW
jgi:hypothetical protein